MAALPVGQPGEALDDEQVRYAGHRRRRSTTPRSARSRWSARRRCRRRPGAIVGPAPRRSTQDGDELRPPDGGRRAWPSRGPVDASCHPAGRGPRRRVRDVLRVALRRPAAVGPRRRGRSRSRRSVGDPMRPLPEIFEGANRGKRGIAVDLKHPPARRSSTAAGEGRRGAAQPAAGRRRAARHRRRLRPRVRARPRLPLLAGLRLVRAEVDAAELRPAAVGLRRASSPSARARATGPHGDVRQRGLLQRPARRVRLPARRSIHRERTGEGQVRRVPAAALVGVSPPSVTGRGGALRERRSRSSTAASTGGRRATASTSASTRGSA